MLMLLYFAYGTSLSMVEGNCPTDRWLNRNDLNETLLGLIQDDTSTIIQEKHDRISMRGKVVVALVNNKFPYLHIIREESRIKLGGYVGDLWMELESMLEFKTVMKENLTDERKSLLDGEADISLNPVQQKASDLDEFGHTMPLGSVWYILYTKKDNNYTNSKVYLAAWRTYLWYAFFVMIAVFTVFIWSLLSLRKELGLENRKRRVIDKRLVSCNIKTSDCKKENRRRKHNIDTSLGNCFLMVLGSVTIQGDSVPVAANSCRICFLAASIFGFLMYNSYSAVLVSQLAVAPTTQKFTSIESIADGKTHALCVSKKSFIYNSFKMKGTESLQHHWKNIINRPPCTVGEEDVVPVNDYCGHSTVVLETPHNTNLLWMDSPGNCTIESLKTRYSYSYISLLARKNWKYTGILSKCLLGLHSAGIVTRLQDHWLPRRRSLSPAHNGNPPAYAVTFNHIRLVLEFYGVAMLFSLIILLAEIILYKSQ